MEPRVSLITLAVSDLNRAVAFYCAGLGWPRSSVGSDAVAFLRLGEVVLALYRATSLAVDLGLPVSQAGPVRMTLAHNVRKKDEVDQVLRQASTAGATVIKPGSQTEWGGYVGYFADPDGHVWEIAWNPGFPLDTAGHVLLPE